jgi:hypothetical protein
MECSWGNLQLIQQQTSTKQGLEMRLRIKWKQI